MLRNQKGVDEVGAEPDGDQKGDEGITHGHPLEPMAERGVAHNQSETADAEGEKDEVEHGAPPTLQVGGEMPRVCINSRSGMQRSEINER